MEFNWSTFILEAVNFVILVWILKRLLYRPIMNVLEERKQKIQGTITKAQTLHDEALALQVKYQNRIQEWEREKDEKRNTFKKEMDEERIRREKNLEQELEKKKEKLRAQEEQRVSEQKRQSQKAAVELAAGFSSRLLEKLAGPELEKKIIDLFSHDLQNLPEEKMRQLKNGLGVDKERVVEIKTAFVLEDTEKEKLQNLLRPFIQDSVSFQFQQDPALIAGLSVSLGPLILEANLRDELSFFVEAARHGE